MSLYRLSACALLLLLLLTIAGCKTMMINGVDLGRAVSFGEKVLTSNKVTLEQEQSMGAQMSAIVLGSAPLLDDSAMQQYVNRVGRWVALQSERPDIQWQFGIIDTNSINAFAMPGGYVLVTHGMLKLLRSEAELAAVLAHEIAHVTDKHYLMALEKNNALSLVSDLAFLASDVYRARKPAAIGDDFYRNRAVAEKLINTTADLYSKGLEREDEFMADSHAVTLLARAGYDHYALAQVLQLLTALNPEDSSLQLLFNSHPLPDDRLLAVEQTYQAHTIKPGLALAERFNKAVQ